MSMLAELGFKYFPLTHTGVPEIVKESRPVGLEKELSELLEVTEYFLKTELNENLLVVVVGEYGWGKTELLDHYTSIIGEKYRGKIEVARVPLTFELSVRHIRSILERRKDKPLVLIIDEADELSRVFSLSRGKTEELAKIITELATSIRAILEPRQYSNVLEIPPAKLSKILLIVAVTPHLYFEVLKSSVPDIFDLTIGRVYREIVIRGEIPLWLYHAILIEKLSVASTRRRLSQVARGKIDAIHPLKFEYIASLYYILYIQERGRPTPRALLKYTAKLLDYVLGKNRLDVDTYIEFLRDIASELEVASRISENVNKVSMLHEDDRTRRIRLLLELCPMPLSERELTSELGRDALSVIRGLLDAGVVEKVAVVRLDLRKRDLLQKINEVRSQYGYPDIPVAEDPRKISIELDSYFTRFENEPTLYAVLPVEAAEQLGLSYVVAYKPKDRVVLKLNESTPELRILDLVRYAYALTSRPRELAKTLARAILREVRSEVQLGENMYVFCGGGGLEVRKCLAFVHVRQDSELESAISRVSDLARNGYIESSSNVIPFDVLVVVVFSPDMSIPSEHIANMVREWKVPGLPLSSLLKIIVFDSGRIHELRQVVAGYLIETSGIVPPQRFAHLVKTYRCLLREVEAFLNEARRVILSDLCLSIRKGREPRQQVLRKIVRAWINREKLLDQPEVFRDRDGTPTLSKPERLFLEYLRSREITRLSQREAEHLVKILFPTHLWRELKERDFIELCRLRGILLQAGNHYIVYSPERAREYIVKRVKALKEEHSRLCIDVEIRLLDNVKVKVCEQLSEDLTLLKNLERKITELVDLRYDEESLRIVSALLQDIEELENRINLQTRRLAEYKHKIGLITESIKQILEQIEQRLRELDEVSLRNLSNLFKSDITRGLETLKELTSTCDSLTITQLYDVLSKVADSLNSKLMLVDRALSMATEMLGLESKCSRHTDTRFAKAVLEDLDLVARFSHDVDTVLSLMERVKAMLTGTVSDYLARIAEEESKMRSFVEWICKSKRVSMYADICKSGIDSEGRLREVFAKLIKTASRELGLSEDALVKLALMRSREITPELFARELNVDVSKAFAILDKLCDLGLARKVYILE